MAFENRDYAKRDTYPDQGWTRAVQWLVIANVAAYLASFVATRAATGFSARDLYELFAFVPEQARHGHRLWSILTYAFVHDLRNPFHLILNMYILWVAGRDLEFIYGTARFLRFYFAAAAFSAALYGLLSALVPEARSAPLLGAAGAAMAVLVVYASYHPGDRILLYLLFEVPIWIGVLIMAGMDLAMVAGSTEGGVLAGGCYIAGAGFGFSWHRFGHRLDGVSALLPFGRSARRPMALSEPPPPPTTASLEAELDEVLRKVHAKGMATLTADEKGVLDRASRHYRRTTGAGGSDPRTKR